MSFNSGVVAGVVAAAGLLVGTQAMASSLVLSYQTLGTSGSPSQTGSGTVNTLSVPGTFNYGDSFLTPTTNTLPDNNYGFYDDYIFMLTNASVDSVSTTVDLGTSSVLSNLSMRLYKVGTGSGNTPPVLGTPQGPVYNASWNTQTFGTTSVATGVITPVDLSAGEYVLELRGDATGTNGGSYGGTMNTSVVPVPGALGLLASGLGLLGGLRRRSASGGVAAA